PCLPLSRAWKGPPAALPPKNYQCAPLCVFQPPLFVIPAADTLSSAPALRRPSRKLGTHSPHTRYRRREVWPGASRGHTLCIAWLSLFSPFVYPYSSYLTAVKAFVIEHDGLQRQSSVRKIPVGAYLAVGLIGQLPTFGLMNFTLAHGQFY